MTRIAIALSISTLAALAACSDSGTMNSSSYSPPLGKADSPASPTEASGEDALSCHLEYQASSPWASGPIDSAVVSLAELENGVAINRDGTYWLSLTKNPSPAYNLSASVALLDAGGTTLAYAVLPPPDVEATPYVFELGASIPTVTASDWAGKMQQFDQLRAYCGWITE